MLMNDKQVAVNDVILRLREAADHYAHAARAIEDDRLAKRFAERCRSLADMAAGLESHIRRLGELPRRPDPEREALEELLMRLGAGIIADERSRHIHALRRREEAIEEAAVAALRQPLPDDTLAEIGRIRDSARDFKVSDPETPE
ncbi:MAG TPA: hypothetical protein VM616_10995 [Gammaproteobacteria bacterium]|nr:hypothetical protein [Gammaproteobacteria bacterium]